MDAILQRFVLLGCHGEKCKMKIAYILLMWMGILFLVSCSKTQPIFPPINSKVLPGVWELRAGSGGMAPYDANNFKPGNGSWWAFKQNDFARIFKDSVYNKGTYQVSTGTGTDLNTGRKIDQFFFNNVPSESFELKGDTLKFYYGGIAYDGSIEMYVKISDDTTSIKW